MAIWRIDQDRPKKVDTTRFRDEKLLEEQLETWIASNPEILGEPLFVVGRQVLIPDTRDRLDLLALDSEGKAVIIEIKRGDVKDPVDVQALRYASYVAKWSFEEFEGAAAAHRGNKATFKFSEAYEEFCEEARGEVPDEINVDQRIIIVGGAVREKLGSVALWLREHSVDIMLIEFRAYRDGESLLIDPAILVPVEVSRFKKVGSARSDGSPWLTDGRVWHLEKRCSPKTKEMLLLLEGLLDEIVSADGPHWDQKHYVAFRRNNFNWLKVHTQPSQLTLDLHVKAKSFEKSEVAATLGVVEFDTEEELSEKLSLPSSVIIKNVRPTTDRIRIRAKHDFDFESEAFRTFVVKAFEASPK